MELRATNPPFIIKLNQSSQSEPNMARYNSLSLQPTLFVEIALVRTWGRIGTMG
ncbi:WGR domain-containing protein [Phyllobacterium myrsinacearum]|uniref:WGR domain-containing protein n=1 Tax=Phyllobacterium myrsinacearum TaxID=28101 RepID=UPI0015FA1055|nr:WGR domain-containing protein [Phyllobacterium myrsinacearum]